MTAYDVLPLLANPCAWFGAFALILLIVAACK